MAEQNIPQILLANPVQGKRETDARVEALLAAFKKAVKTNKPFNITESEVIIAKQAISSTYSKLFNGPQEDWSKLRFHLNI